MKTTIINSVLLGMIRYFNHDFKRINHAIKVHTFAKLIGEQEGLSEEKLFILELASVLHDIGIHEAERKYSSSSGKYQEQEGPIVAKEILKPYELSQRLQSRVEYLIGNHHSYSMINGIDFQILVEADFIVNCYEDSFEQGQINNVYERIFKTQTGKEIFQQYR